MAGNHNAGNLKEASVFLRIINKLRLSDEEQAKTEFALNGPQYTWKPQPNGYGTKTIDLEGDEAKALILAIEALTPMRVADAIWLAPLVDELKAAAP